jgi:hypothetical protein
MSKSTALKQTFFFVFLQACFFFSLAQSPDRNMQTDEMKKMIAELRKEVSNLEIEIKKAEIEDPEAVSSLKAQLNTYQKMLAAFDKPAPAASKAATGVSKKILPQTASPLVKVHLRQPVVAPIASQATDRFFWYRGKKINDSTLVTSKRTVVQYSRKRQILIVQPEEKKDSFVTIAKEISRSEQRKRELIDGFDKIKNGFIYYPYITTSMAVYDDLTVRFSKAVNNTIAFDGEMPNLNRQQQSSRRNASQEEGHNFVSFASHIQSNEESTINNDALEWVLQQLDDARRKCDQLPSIESFPAPPAHDLGRCASCDTVALNRQRKLDESWENEYQGKEAGILKQALSAMRVLTFQGDGGSGDIVDQKFRGILDFLTERIAGKDRILLDRYGDKLQYLPVIVPVILGHERQRQLLGAGEESSIGDLMGKTFAAYRKYYDEQVAAKNHDFVLNIPFHLGMYRQLALIGGDQQVDGIGEHMNKFLAYNRFALTMELDFVWQSGPDDDIGIRATGKMATPEKIYVLFVPDSCGYKMLAYSTDLENKKFEDITIPLKVNAGVKTMRDENNKLKDYPYQGAPEYAFRFPDCRIDFCSEVPDTLLLAVVGGNEEVGARAGGDLQNMRKSYTIEMLLYAAQVLINEDVNQLIQGMHDDGNEILNTVAGMMQQAAPETTLEKFKMQYGGYMNMDNVRKGFEGSYATQTARILFNASNRSTVLTDTYIDTKRKMEDNVEVKKGLFHLRMVHEPKK